MQFFEKLAHVQVVVKLSGESEGMVVITCMNSVQLVDVSSGIIID